MKGDIEKIKTPEDVGTLLKQTYEGLVQVLAGVAGSDSKEWAISIGYLLQRVRGKKFLKTEDMESTEGKPLSNVISIDEGRVKQHLDTMVRGAVEETLNALTMSRSVRFSPRTKCRLIMRLGTARQPRMYAPTSKKITGLSYPPKNSPHSGIADAMSSL